MTIAAVASGSRPPRFPLTVRHFAQMVDAGMIRGRIELVHGELLEMSAVGNAHSIAVEDLRDAIRPQWPDPKFVRTQATHRFADDWAPMPDLVLLRQRPVPGALLDELPQLVIEVSDETLRYDLGEKRLDYARAGVPEYWVADLKRRRILIFRQPDRTATAPELAYLDEAIAGPDDEVSPLAIPSLRIRVRDVLPATGVG